MGASLWGLITFPQRGKSMRNSNMGSGLQIRNVKPVHTNRTDELRGQQKSDLKENVEVKRDEVRGHLEVPFSTVFQYIVIPLARS